MPDFIKVEGQAVYRPGVFPRVDAEALAGLGPSPTGIVAVIGEFTKGGPPLVPLSVTSAIGLRRLLSARDAAIIGQLAFAPSRDPRIPNGAARLILIRVNDAQRARLVLRDEQGQDSVILLAADYGAEGNETAVQVAESTLYEGAGRKVIATFRGATEAIDNIGYGNVVASIGWAPQLQEGDIYEYCRLGLRPHSVCLAEWSIRTPKPNEGNKVWTANVPIEGHLGLQTTNDDGDPTAPGIGHTVTIEVEGIAADGTQQSETVTIEGTEDRVITETVWKKLIKVTFGGQFGSATYLRLVGNAFEVVGAVTVQGLLNTIGDKGCGLKVRTENVAALNMAQLDGVNALEMNTEDWPFLAAATKGEIRAKIVVTEATWGGANGPVSYSAAWSGKLTFTLSGALADALVLTVSGVDYRTNQSAIETVIIEAGDLSAATKTKWANVISITKNISLGGVSLAIETEGLRITRDLDALIEAINRKMTLIVAERANEAIGLPATMPARLNLSGGADNIPAPLARWQAAIDLLRDPGIPVNHVVCLTDDLAVQRYVVDHVDYMCGRGMGVRNAFLGVPSGSGWSTLKERRQVLSSRNVALLAQSITIFDDAGNQVTLPPYYAALLAAACDAGRAPGQGLTWRYVSILGATDGAGLPVGERWSIADDLDELIENGIFVLEKRPNGWRWSRDVTTYAVDNNPIFCSVTANESANRSVENVRRALEQYIGALNTAILAAAIKARVIEELTRQKRETEIKDFDPRSIEIEDLGNGFNVGYRVAVLESVYWIRLTAHVVRMPSSV